MGIIDNKADDLLSHKENSQNKNQTDKNFLFYKQTYEHLSFPIIVLTPTYKIEFINTAAQQFYNLKTDSIISKTCQELNCSSVVDSDNCPVPEVLRTKEPIDMVVSNHFGVDNCPLRAFPILDENEEVISIVIEDLSSIESVKNQAIELESRFKKTVELATDAIFILSKGCIIEFVNSTALEMLGNPDQDIIGGDFREYLNDNRVIAFLESMYNGETKNDSICYYSEESVLFGKEKLHAVEICISRVKDRNDQLKMYLYLRNITEEKKLQNDLKQTNEFFRNMINRSVDGIIASDVHGNIIIFNESAEKLLGYSSDEAINSIHITKIYRPGVAKEVMAMLRSEEFGGIGKMETIEAIIVSKEGSEIPCNLSAALIYDKDNKELASVGIFSDLRERKRMQKELEETQMKLLQAEKMSSLGKLAAGIAHEINNPLGGIMMFSNMMLEDIDEESEIRDDLKRIVSETARCKDIVKGLLEFSRQTDYKMSLVDLNRLLEQGMSLLENQAIFHNIVVVKDYDVNLPLIKCDSARLSQTFINIILNAIDAMGRKGTFTISTYYNRETNRAEIKFIDTGCGIPDDIMPRIFDPFFTTKEVGKGTGLGLSMTYGIIKDHGGSINIKSKVGEGTCFIIELPIDG
ncbi:MAG: PAS domain S-box protein [Spirochaetota bacterium]|nr:PAS domain S-box protein [Spirochaetota bacterium]